MPNQARNYIIDQIENEDKKERMIDGVKSANKTQDRVVFGKPRVGKTLAKIYGAIVLIFLLVIAVFIIFDVFPNTAVDKHYILSFETYGGTLIASYEYDETKTLSLPDEPVKEGYLFVDWYLDDTYTTKVTSAFLRSIDDHGDLTFYAKWVPDDLQISLTFDTNGGSLITSQSLLVATDLSSIIPIKDNVFFAGWFLEPTFQTHTTQVPYENSTLYAMWSPIELVTVGQSNQSYTFPVGKTDYNTDTLNGGFQLAKTETTYQLWYEVRNWAEQHDYTFQNLGKEGNDGVIGAEPTLNSLEPVTNISYLDTIVWLNAFSELYNLDPIYRVSEHNVLRDSRINLDETYLLVYTNYNGYRLPSFIEWEMAARWTNDTEETTYIKLVQGRFWTIGSMFSGGKEIPERNLVSMVWYSFNSLDKTHVVATKNANDLGLYDMNGNVSEWVDYAIYSSDSEKPIRGGSYSSSSFNVIISEYDFIAYSTTLNDIGFRIAIGSVN